MSLFMVKNNKTKKTVETSKVSRFPPRLIKVLADEVAKTVVQRLPRLIPRRIKNKNSDSKKKFLEKSFFLDTSAIIDGRIFDVIALGFVTGSFVILDSILLELKHVADSQDSVKRLRGRKGLELLEKLKKTKGVKLHILIGSDEEIEVDEKLIRTAKMYKGRIVTCDYNLEKKAAISGLLAININTLANSLKVKAVPGEALNINILHKGKEVTQGVGYLDDGTMIVVENASSDLGKAIDVIVSRIIQTTAGRILFAKKI